jgi:hypothetical protein
VALNRPPNLGWLRNQDGRHSAGDERKAVAALHLRGAGAGKMAPTMKANDELGLKIRANKKLTSRERSRGMSRLPGLQ